MSARSISLSDNPTPTKIWAQIFVGVGLSESDIERALILKTLRKNGYTVRDLTENDMAKLHIRHMVGGQ